MYKELKDLVLGVLMVENDRVYNSIMSVDNKLEKQNDIFNLMKTIEHYEELEPMIAKYINEKASEKRFRGGQNDEPR